MSLNQNYLKKTIDNFIFQNKLTSSWRNAAMIWHLYSKYAIAVDTASTQSSISKDDNGIDGWCYDEKEKKLCIFQSKTDAKKMDTLKGLDDLLRASKWIFDWLSNDGNLSRKPKNPCLYNFIKYAGVQEIRKKLKHISFILSSLFEKEEFTAEKEIAKIQDFEERLSTSDLHKYIHNNLKGKISIEFDVFVLKPQSLPNPNRVYTVNIIKGTDKIWDDSRLHIAYLPLYELVELAKERGENAINQNIRMPLIHLKKSKDLLTNPMFETLDKICNKKLTPDAFPFFHVGVTLAASLDSIIDQNLLKLRCPSIINGCQTTAIALDYYNKLENNAQIEKIEEFKKIVVLAKILIGSDHEKMRELTNNNNRQIPVESWQLFSNHHIHFSIERFLRENASVFYERQKGKFENDLKNETAIAITYSKTNGTFITVKDLGRIIAMIKRMFDYAGHPDKIFKNEAEHSKIFNDSIVENSRFASDIVYLYNADRAVTRAFIKVLDDKMERAGDTTMTYERLSKIKSDPIIRAMFKYVCIIWGYQKTTLESQWSNELQKRAATNMVRHFEDILIAKVFSKVSRRVIECAEENNGKLTRNNQLSIVDEVFTELNLSHNNKYPLL